jgi:hypothetical protein
MKAPNASAARVDGIAATSQCDQKRARPRRQGGGKPRPGQTRMGAPAPAARGPKVALCGPENAREGGPPWPGWWATPPAGDLNHDLVQVDESAIAGNVGRDLAFTTSRLAARSHPAAGRCGRLCCALSLVMFGISHPNARSTVGRSRPPGQQCSLCARIRHDRAHICREDDGRGTSRSHATACSRRAVPRGKKDGTRAPRAGLPRVSVRVLASMRTGSPNRRCSCTRSVRRSRTSSATSTRRVSNPPGQAKHPDTSPPSTDGTNFILDTSPRAPRPSRPPTPATTHPQRSALAGVQRGGRGE